MLRQHFQLGRWSNLVSSAPTLPFSPNATHPESPDISYFSTFLAVFRPIRASRTRSICCAAARRRAVRYDEDDEEEEENDVEYGHNKEIAVLELYSQSVRGEALIVHALVDDQEAEVLIFKGFSSCLSYRTSPDPSKSVLPARAVIKSIDRVRGPFDPSNIEYLQKALTWEEFTGSILPPQLRSI